jgi:hypothetical protein
MLDAQGLRATVALGRIEDSLGGAGFSRPNRIPPLGSLLEVSVNKELLVVNASRVGPSR